jgi:hypothetical protein
LAGRIGTPSDKGAHGPVRLERHDGTLRDIELLSAPLQRLLERLLGGGLQRPVDGGLDHDVGLERTNIVVEQVHHPIGWIVRR